MIIVHRTERALVRRMPSLERRFFVKGIGLMEYGPTIVVVTVCSIQRDVLRREIVLAFRPWQRHPVVKSSPQLLQAVFAAP